MAVTVETVDVPRSWGLDRIDQSSLPLDNEFHYTWTGQGVDVYVVDTGLALEHEEFEGRASCAWDLSPTKECWDGDGHGTHVAGIIGGKTYGVAKQVSLKAVKVIDSKGKGRLSDLVEAIDYVHTQAMASERAVVVNLSLGNMPSRILRDVIRNATAAGVVFVVAAGNEGLHFCAEDLSSLAEVVTVGATDAADVRGNYSNYGPCVDVFAPGSNIASTWTQEESDFSHPSLTGTSMASAHVAGAAALYLEAYPTLSGTGIRRALGRDSKIGVIEDTLDNYNRFLNLEAVNAASRHAEGIPASSFAYSIRMWHGFLAAAFFVLTNVG